MLTVNIGTVSFQCAGSWEELSLKRYIQLSRWDKSSYITLCEALLDTTLVHSANLSDLEKLIPHLKWIESPFTGTLADLPDTLDIDGKPCYYPLDLTKEPFISKYYMDKQVNDLLSSMSVHDALLEASPFVLSCYLYSSYTGKPFTLDAVNEFQKVIEELPMAHTVPLVNEYYRQRLLMNQRWKLALSADYTEDEVKAGVRKFDRFGMFGTVLNLAGGKVWMMDAVWQLPYNQIFLSLAYSKQQREYQRKYDKILKRKKPKS